MRTAARAGGAGRRASWPVAYAERMELTPTIEVLLRYWLERERPKWTLVESGGQRSGRRGFAPASPLAAEWTCADGAPTLIERFDQLRPRRLVVSRLVREPLADPGLRLISDPQPIRSESRQTRWVCTWHRPRLPGGRRGAPIPGSSSSLVRACEPVGTRTASAGDRTLKGAMHAGFRRHGSRVTRCSTKNFPPAREFWELPSVRGVTPGMARFLTGLACGALIVGACWYGNRLGYKEGRADGVAAQSVAAPERERDPASRARDDGLWAAPAISGEVSDAGDCLLATWPPKRCGAARARAAAPPADSGYRLGSRRSVQREDPDGHWEKLPPPEISPTDRAKLVAELEARARK